MRWQNDDAERQALEEELGKAGGSIKHTARLLDVHRNTVYFRMKKYGIDLSQFRKLRGISSNGGMS
ncbi:MAG: helix-turn-helix domain-containing protein [candidate division KSB1 bacterium]|nr:helix-turn-helix domain-containing protein [candidate division KSB1 bacterium]